MLSPTLPFGWESPVTNSQISSKWQPKKSALPTLSIYKSLANTIKRHLDFLPMMTLIIYTCNHTLWSKTERREGKREKKRWVKGLEREKEEWRRERKVEREWIRNWFLAWLILNSVLIQRVSYTVTLLMPRRLSGIARWSWFVRWTSLLPWTSCCLSTPTASATYSGWRSSSSSRLVLLGCFCAMKEEMHSGMSCSLIGYQM